MNLILFGAPGAGKGTQTGSLIETYHIPAIATGDMLRAQRRAGSALGDQVKGYMDRGELVPDALMIDIIRTRLQEPDARQGLSSMASRGPLPRPRRWTPCSTSSAGASTRSSIF